MGNFVDSFLPGINPPTLYQIFAPDGDSMVVMGHLVSSLMGPNQPHGLIFRNAATREDIPLNKKVVAIELNQTNGEFLGVAYDPRVAGKNNCDWFTDHEKKWLKEHPEWPDILELIPNPVDVEDNDGLWTNA